MAEHDRDGMKRLPREEPARKAGQHDARRYDPSSTRRSAVRSSLTESTVTELNLLPQQAIAVFNDGRVLAASGTIGAEASLRATSAAFPSERTAASTLLCSAAFDT